MPGFANAVYEVARKEVMQHIRTKRLLIIGLAMALLLFVATLVFGPNIVRTIGNEGPNASENQVLAFYFGFGLIGGLVFTQLLAIVLTTDAVCSEWSNRTIFLLLSKPVSRTAFVLGKFLGNVVVLSGTIVVLFGLDYLFMQMAYDGSPSGQEVMGFVLTVLLIILGCTAFAAIALFFSSLTRSTIMSTLITLALWIIVFPLIGSIGLFTSIGDPDVGRDGEDFFDSPRVQSTLYLNPASDMQAVVQLLLPHDDGEFTTALRFLNFFNPAPNNVGLAVLALAGYAAVFLAASIVVVQRRDFE
jgi:ABC-type transport system involved in multi-copper enzyme maturation permease subunit